MGGTMSLYLLRHKPSRELAGEPSSTRWKRSLALDGEGCPVAVRRTGLNKFVSA